MRALPELLRKRPQAKLLIVGGDDVGYGPNHPKGMKWKDIFFNEVREAIGPENLKRFFSWTGLPTNSI